jgi:hypothetical protein
MPGIWVAIFLFVLTATATPAAAGTINGSAEANYNEAKMVIRDPGTADISNQSQNLSQLYRLNLQTELAPKLRLSAGTLFARDLTDSESGTETTASALNRWQPRADLYLTDTFLQGSLGGSRRDETRSATGNRLTLINEEYHGYVNWRPAGLPKIGLQLSQVDNYDAGREIENTRRRRGVLSLRYSAVKNLDLRYQYANEHSDNRLFDFATRGETHSGGINYSGTLAGRRVVYSTGLSFNRLTVTSMGPGSGEFALLRPAGAGLSAIDTIPAITVLDENRLLIDSDLSASTGIDIGALDPSDLSSSLWRNLGLDFTLPVSVNHLRVQLNRELPEPIAAAFAWEIYSSADNQEWVLWQRLAAAPFDPLEKHFDLRFLPVTSRYLKVTVRPLSQTVALQYPQEDWQSIPITELQAFSTQSIANLGRETTSATETGTFDVRIRLSKSPALYYRSNLLAGHRNDTDGIRYTLVNSLNLNHPLSPALSTVASVGREESNSGAHYTSVYLLSAGLNYVPLPQASGSLTYSGRIEPQTNGNETAHSLYLYTLAEPYRGINISFGTGINQKITAEGDRITGTTLNATTSLLPNPAISLDCGYALSRSRRSGETTIVSMNQHGDAMLNIRLTPALALFAGVAVDDESDRAAQLTRNFGSSWVPFRDGTLRLSFAWNESWRSSDDSWTRSIVPGLNWRITRRSTLQLSAPVTTNRIDAMTTTVHAINANLKISF